MLRRSIAVLLAVWLCMPTMAFSQFIQRNVGGVFIDAQGLLRNLQVDERNELRAAAEKALHQLPGKFKDKVEMRKISLRLLEEAIQENLKSGTPIPDEIQFLAGLQRIQYVFVYPELNDIVLAGPGEGWKLNDKGEVVGVTTGRPVLLLDDLLVALRTADTSRQTGISCSIDPTAEGLQKLQSLAKKLTGIGPNPQATISSIEQTLGPQTISVNGVPANSHFARVLVAADYRMKRLAMNFDPSPIKGLPSFLSMTKAGPKGMTNMLPRWWLEPNYDAVLVDPDGMAYELRGAGVKAMAEEDFLSENGNRENTRKASPVAKKWADNMTAHYDELSAKEAIFGELRNCMDLAVVAALIVKEHLPEKAGYSMPLLLNSSDLKAHEFEAPHQVDSQASVLQKGTNWLISASGGVQVNSWGPLEKTKASTALAPVRAKAVNTGKSWWWN